MKLHVFAAAAIIGFATPALAQQMSAEDFASTAASSDMFEIQSSQMALEKSQDEAVSGFAQMMVNDHTAATEKLKAAAQEAGVTVPAEMNEKHAQQLQSLEGLSDSEFDAGYIDAQVTAHEEALALMQNYAESGDNEALKAHAEETAPIIQRHHDQVKELDSGS